MADLIASFGLGTVVIILIVGIGFIISIINWCKQIWTKREKFKQEQFQEGRKVEAKKEKEEVRLHSAEARIDALEKVAEQLVAMAQRHERSDQLAIKTYIKEQHDIWMVKGFIDGQVLELLETRFAIYQEEGGNSWAEKLMQDLRGLPIAVIPSHAEKDNNE